LTVGAACIARFADAGGSWHVQVSYRNKTGSTAGPFSYALPNGIPGYQYCTPSGFQASWGQQHGDPGVSVTGTGGNLSGCDNWSYEVRSPQQTCGADTTNQPPDPGVTIPLTCSDDPQQGTWTVVVTWTDSANRPQTSDPITVTGEPPGN
jgi:hypothetical protein